LQQRKDELEPGRSNWGDERGKEKEHSHNKKKGAGFKEIFIVTGERKVTLKGDSALKGGKKEGGIFGKLNFFANRKFGMRTCHFGGQKESK